MGSARGLWQNSANHLGRSLPRLGRIWQGLADIALLGGAKLNVSKSTIGTARDIGTARELQAGDNPTTTARHKGDVMSDSTSNDTMRHRRLVATSWFVLATAATAAAALAVPRYRRNHSGI